VYQNGPLSKYTVLKSP